MLKGRASHGGKKVGNTVTVAEKSRVEVKHKKASQGRKRQNYSVKDSKKRQKRGRRQYHKTAVSNSRLTDKQEFVLA